MHKFVNHNDGLPDDFLQYFTTKSAIHESSTRARMDFHFYPVNESIGKMFEIQMNNVIEPTSF